jgi:general secretion pathway protein H
MFGAVGRGRERGFTLIEIIVVLVIIAIAAALVAPSIDSSLRQRSVRSAVRTVMGAVRAMQSEAILSGSVQTMLLDPRENTLRLAGTDDFLYLGDIARLARVRGGETDGSGTTLVKFYPNGSNDGLDVVIDDRERPSDLGFAVRVNPIIGTIEVGDAER